MSGVMIETQDVKYAGLEQPRPSVDADQQEEKVLVYFATLRRLAL
jgi:hypothetical protein